ncbi:MAG: methyltransferase domain-containing protein [Proteobacteria bacterium]|nr:methyltransferase domain-containing protein [Pseudomonadota bacterium]
MSNKSCSFRICPWWLGYFLVSPLRKLLDNPEKILSPHVRAGMTALDVGPGMGYFTLPLAKIVGPSGRVIAVDLQEKMLSGLQRRAKRAGLSERIECRLASEKSLNLADLAGRVNFALACYVVHEVPDPERLLSEIARALAPGGRLLIVEPPSHISRADFEKYLALAQKNGLSTVSSSPLGRKLSALLEKPTG